MDNSIFWHRAMLFLTLKTHCNRACAAFEQLLLPGIVFCTIVHLLPYFVDVARLGSDEISCVSAYVCVCVCVCAAQEPARLCLSFKCPYVISVKYHN